MDVDCPRPSIANIARENGVEKENRVCGGCLRGSRFEHLEQQFER